MPYRPIRDVIKGQTLVTLSPDITVRRAAVVMAEHNIGAAPVLLEGCLVGILTERDIMTRVVARDLDTDATPLEQVMTRTPETIPADRSVVHALHIMYENGFRHLPVTENGKIIGIISTRDARALDLLDFERDTEFRETVAASLAA